MCVKSLSSIARLQRACNLRYTVRSTDLQLQFEHSETNRLNFRFSPKRTIPAGWYMICVEPGTSLVAEHIHFKDVIGGEFSLFISAKPEIKRVVYFSRLQDHLEIECTVDLSRFVDWQFNLVRISRVFALSRMQRKLAYASSATNADESSTEELYWRYNKRFDRRAVESQYPDWYKQHQKTIQRRAEQIHISGDSVPVIKLHAADTPRKFAHALQNPNNTHICIVGAEVEIHPFFLRVIAGAIEQHPHAQLIYTDHDVVNDSGAHVYPCFKPAWNPELLLSGNYIGQVVVVCSRLVEQVGVAEFAFEESAVYSLLLALSRFIAPENVLRLPFVLHSNKNENGGAENYLSPGKRDAEVLCFHLEKQQLNARVTPGLIPGSQRVHWALPPSEPLVNIVIPSRDKHELLRTCVESILEKTHYIRFQITVVDNDSSEKATHEYYRAMGKEPRFNLLSYSGEFNFSAMNNYAIKQGQGDVVVLLNNDTEIINSDWLKNMVAQAIRPQVGCVGAKLYYPNGLLQHAGVIVGMFGMAGHAHRLEVRNSDGYCGRLKLSQNVTAVTAACLAVRRETYLKVGGLDELNLKVAYNDVDFCLRVREAGYHNVWTPHAELFHHESISRGSEDTRQKRNRFRKEFAYMQSRWHTKAFADEAYNPNLSLDSEDFSLAA